MTAATLAKIATVRSGDLARRYQPSAAVIEALRANPTADGAARKLIDEKAVDAAIELLAHALPRREAVWWAATCVRERLPEPAPAVELRLLAGAEDWVRKPSDEQRRAVFELARAEGMGTPAGLVASAVFFSGDTLGPADRPPVPPAGNLVGTMVVNAVRIAATRLAAQEGPQWLAEFLTVGIDIASGGSGRKREVKAEESV